MLEHNCVDLFSSQVSRKLSRRLPVTPAEYLGSASVGLLLFLPVASADASCHAAAAPPSPDSRLRRGPIVVV